MRIRVFENETTETDGAPASGTGEDTEVTPPVESPAEAEKTDTTGREEPGPIPYSRFKEVNDQLRELKPYSELADMGVDADSARALVQFDQAYQTDPVGTWVHVARQMGDTLPEPLRNAIAELVGTSEESKPPAAKEGEGDSEDEIPEWAKPLIQDKESRELTAAQEASSQALNDILAKWDEADTKEFGKDKGIPMRTRLRLIQIASGEGGTFDEIYDRAREEALAEREELLASAIVRPGGRGVTAVPGGGAPVNGDEPPATLAEASAGARRFIEEQNKQRR